MSEAARPNLGRLADIMARLRAPDGCPWDRKQSQETLRPFLLEECYEVLDVMAGDDPDAHREELGDLLFQIVFQARLREEKGEFTLADVVAGISDKLERRHPHVFGPDTGLELAPEEVAERWEAIKRSEGKGKGTIDDIPRAQPALSRAAKVGSRVSRVGFDWPDIEGPLAKVHEELSEVQEALAIGDAGAIHDEIGDLLFAVVNVARHALVAPELALTAATDRFLARYRHVQSALDTDGITIEAAGGDRLDRLWAEAKAALRDPSGA